jgi:hypothetical protein
MAFKGFKEITLPFPRAYATLEVECCMQRDKEGMLININEGPLEHPAMSARVHSDKRHITGALGAETLSVANIDFGCGPCADWQYAAKFDLAFYPGRGWFMDRLQKSARQPLRAARSQAAGAWHESSRARSRTRSRSRSRSPVQPASSRQIRRRSPSDGHP